MKLKNIFFWYVSNARNKTLGKLIKIVLNICKIQKNFFHKEKKYFFIFIIMNINNIKFTGGKLKKNFYYDHSGYPGGLKKKSIIKMYFEKTKIFISKTIKNMMKKNRESKFLIKNIKLIKNISNKYKNKKLKFINI